MAKEYKVGEKYYLPVKVEEVVNTNYGVKISFEDGAGVDTTHICEFPDVLLTADEITIMPHTGMTDALEELKTKVASLQEENEKLTAELKKWYAGYVSQSDYAELSKAYTDKCAELEAFKAEHDKYVMDLEEARDGAVDESLERKNRVTTMEEVIVALVEKIRRLEGGEQ